MKFHPSQKNRSMFLSAVDGMPVKMPEYETDECFECFEPVGAERVQIAGALLHPGCYMLVLAWVESEQVIEREAEVTSYQEFMERHGTSTDTPAGP